jgi:integrase
MSRKHLGALLLTGWHSAQRANVLLRAEIDWLAVVDENLTLTADREKMHDEGFTSVLLPTTDSTICPVETLLEWLDLRAQYVDEGCSRLFPVPAIRDGEFVLVDHISVARSHLLRTTEDARSLTPEALDHKAYVWAYTFYNQRLKKLANAVGISPAPDRYLATHSTRRGIITALRDKGLDPQVIAARVSGHANPSTVLRYDDSYRLPGRAHPVSDLGL